jgi:hypothetical protein
MFIIGKDVAAKTMIFFTQRQVLNSMIQTIKEATANQYTQAPPPQPQPQQAQPQAQPQAQREETYEDDFSVVSDAETKSSGSGIKPDIIVAPKKRGRPKR